MTTQKKTEFPELVCLDTNVWVHASNFKAGLDVGDAATKAGRLVERIIREKAKILIPSVVLAELLYPHAETEHQELMSRWGRAYLLGSFNPAAARNFSVIWRKRKTDGTLEGLKKAIGKVKGRTKAELRADMMIVAEAFTIGAGRIYTNDTDMQKIALGFVEAMNVPSVPIEPQQDLGEDTGAPIGDLLEEVNNPEPTGKGNLRSIKGGKADS